MRPLLGALLLLLATSPFAGAQTPARQWVSGKWAAPPNDQTYRIETATYRVQSEDVEKGERRAIEVTVGAAVRFAVVGDKVYFLDRGNIERTLHLTRRVELVYDALGGGHLIKAVGAGGTTVTLEDGSTWQVDPRNHYATAEWQPQEGVSVRKADPQDGFSYEVDNTDRDEGTLARYVVPD